MGRGMHVGDIDSVGKVQILLDYALEHVSGDEKAYVIVEIFCKIF